MSPRLYICWGVESIVIFAAVKDRKKIDSSRIVSTLFILFIK